MRKLLLIFSLLTLAIPAFAGNVTGNITMNVTENHTNATLTNTTIPALNISHNYSRVLTNTTLPDQMNETTPLNISQEITPNQTNQSVSIEELVVILQAQLEDLKKQNQILNEEIKTLRRENMNLTQRISELEREPVTFEDVEESVNKYYVQFVYWTGWAWPALAFFLIFRYRRPALEVEEERIHEAVDRIVKEKQREWYSYQIRRQGLEEYTEDETELAIFRALGIHTIADLLGKNEQDLLDAFKRKYQPTEDIEEHFRNRIREIKEKLKEADINA